MKFQNKHAFSLVEILVGIVLFLIGIVSVFSIIQTTLRLNDNNEDYIVAVNLAREQLELVRNIRDTNFKRIQAYDFINPNDLSQGRFSTGSYYTVQNNFESSALFPIQVTDLGSSFDYTNASYKNKVQLCLDSGRYEYCNGVTPSQSKKTKFHKYIHVEEVTVGSDVKNAIMVTSVVKWYNKKHSEYKVSAVFTDYKIY